MHVHRRSLGGGEPNCELSVVTGLSLLMRWFGHFLGLRRTQFALISSAAAVSMHPETICARGTTFGALGTDDMKCCPSTVSLGSQCGKSSWWARLSRASSPREKLNHPSLRDVIHAVVHPDEDGYFVECLEVAVVTQGDTLDDLVRNLDEALSLHLEGEDLAALGLSSHPKVQLIVERPLAL